MPVPREWDDTSLRCVEVRESIVRHLHDTIVEQPWRHVIARCGDRLYTWEFTDRCLECGQQYYTRPVEWVPNGPRYLR